MNNSLLVIAHGSGAEKYGILYHLILFKSLWNNITILEKTLT